MGSVKRGEKYERVYGTLHESLDLGDIACFFNIYINFICSFNVRKRMR